MNKQHPRTTFLVHLVLDSVASFKGRSFTYRQLCVAVEAEYKARKPAGAAIPESTISNILSTLLAREPDKIERLSRGLYRATPQPEATPPLPMPAPDEAQVPPVSAREFRGFMHQTEDSVRRVDAVIREVLAEVKALRAARAQGEPCQHLKHKPGPVPGSVICLDCGATCFFPGAPNAARS